MKMNKGLSLYKKFSNKERAVNYLKKSLLKNAQIFRSSHKCVKKAYFMHNLIKSFPCESLKIDYSILCKGNLMLLNTVFGHAINIQPIGSYQ